MNGIVDEHGIPFHDANRFTWTYTPEGIDDDNNNKNTKSICHQCRVNAHFRALSVIQLTVRHHDARYSISNSIFAYHFRHARSHSNPFTFIYNTSYIYICAYSSAIILICLLCCCKKAEISKIENWPNNIYIYFQFRSMLILSLLWLFIIVVVGRRHAIIIIIRM